MFGVLSLCLYYQFHQISHHHHHQFHQISCHLYVSIINSIKIHIIFMSPSSIPSNFTSLLHCLHVFIINPIKFHIVIMSLSSIPSNFTSSSSSIPSNFILSSCLHH